MKIRILIPLILVSIAALAQKPLITDSSYTEWPEIRYAKISRDGQFAFYNVFNLPIGNTTTVVIATDKSWQWQQTSLGQSEFSTDSKYFYTIRNNYLVKVKLGDSAETQISKTNSFQQLSSIDGDYLIYRSDSSQAIVVSNQRTKVDLKINDVNDYKIIPTNRALLLMTKNDEENQLQVLKWLDVKSGIGKTIYQGNQVSNLIFDKSGENIAFATDSVGTIKLWHYNIKYKTAKQVLNTGMVGHGRLIKVDDIWEFSNDGSRLYFTLPDAKPRYVQAQNDPDVWSYQDKLIYPQMKQRGFTQFADWRNLTMIDLRSLKLTQILRGNEQKGHYSHRHGNNMFVMKVVDSADQNVIFTKDARTSYYLVDEISNIKKPIKLSAKKSLYNIEFSPDNKFVTYIDEETEGYMSYEIATQKTCFFSESVLSELKLYQDNARAATLSPRGIIGWIKGTNRVLIMGTYGIWELDVKNQIKPRNLTNVKHDQEIFFSLCDRFEKRIIDPKQDIYIQGVEFETKKTGVYKLNIKSSTFDKLYDGNFYWGAPYETLNINQYQRSENADAFLVRFATAQKYPNILFTKDFVRFDTLTTFCPEQKYNWLTSELHIYKDSTGRNCQGILYKPENFDPKRKYPVIFTYYQDQAKFLHEYLSPSPVPAGINVPHLVSNGYLVFRPDIYIEEGKVGAYVLMSINAAADHLSGFNWVDSSKMGITGHSFGGYETNYIITHTSRFAAAIAGAGVTNLVSNTLDLWGDKAEKRQYARDVTWMGVDFEDNPQPYIDNSPIFKTKNVTTPVLILHSEDDANVPYYQGTQFFTSLRHLGKSAWLLSYKDGGHTVGGLENQIDYMKKVQSFFDHYLKNKPIPAWMQKHIE
ncbi:alpha/beta hydrolase family protein [Chitinophaga rhizophila]|uniref:Prolyl oligopeptidase family serine peptidase n=1 Tax=Chitinophaga rhizophila TaxID=2866212 RepID=A0ABS7GHS8_9BACT|nr:prolyl oligopeptidase family serine peptidase [Chitinophaga rhizophila]MBW8687251.1 prolyl oligopeptidase family serine peptidase [Chitinophaga rhizophila]